MCNLVPALTAYAPLLVDGQRVIGRFDGEKWAESRQA